MDPQASEKESGAQSELLASGGHVPIKGFGFRTGVRP